MVALGHFCGLAVLKVRIDGQRRGDLPVEGRRAASDVGGGADDDVALHDGEPAADLVVGCRRPLSSSERTSGSVWRRQNGGRTQAAKHAMTRRMYYSYGTSDARSDG